ncbi:MAG: aldo/keto reductase [bacterium]
MRYRLLGRSGLRVSELCLGTMTFGEEWGWGASAAESRKIFDRYAEAGGNFLDTANKYTDGTSEKIVGDLIAFDRGHFVLATKYSLTTRPEDPNFSGNHRKNMVQSVEASLRRLKTDYIDLYWLHAWDYLTPIDEVLRAFDDLVRAGKILYCGISDTPAWIVSAANTTADLRGWSPFVALQIEYSLIERTPERELLPMAKALDLAVLAWSPLGSGLLTGKYKDLTDTREGARLSEGSRRLTERNLAISRAVVAVAKELGVSPAQVAIRWLRDRQGVVIPMIGARNVAQLEDNLGALDVELPPTVRAQLDAASAIELGFPHDFLGMESIRQIVYGTSGDAILRHR